MSGDAAHADVYVQFADFDGTNNLFPFVPLAVLPSRGDRLNLKKENVTHFLEVEDYTHFIDCDVTENPRHSITIDCKLLRSYAPNK